MTTTKRKNTKHFLKWIKDLWPLIIICMIPIIILTVYFVRAIVERQQLNARFDTTYTQLSEVYRQLRVDSKDGMVSKKCQRQYNGFNSTIECRVEVEIYAKDDARGEVLQKELERTLTSAGFLGMNFGSATFSYPEKGSVQYRAANDMPCGGYWGPEYNGSTQLITSLYCQETVSNFLPGYMVESQ